jgi:decaprenyl-phosphate phosphoribosyltransferase
MIKDIIKLLRVKQYVKNLFIFLPTFFGLHFFDLGALSKDLIAFVSFCFIASSIYVLNDILDVESDKKHPTKKNRPIASGRISVKKAIIIMIILLILGLCIALLLNNLSVLIFIGIYLVINILYVFWIKHIGIIDIFAIASGYVIRVLIGGAAGGIQINPWIIIMTFLLALFLGFAKRRDDVLIMQNTGKVMRKSINGYNLQFIDSALFITSAITIVAYLMYTISPETIARYGTGDIYVTTLFVLLGILRYLQITVAMEKSGSPTEMLYKDRILQFSIIAWIISFLIIIYL